MDRRKLLLGLSAAAGAAAVFRFETMPQKKRCELCSKPFVGALFALGKGLPEPKTDVSAEKPLFYKVKKPKGKAGWRLGYAKKSILPTDFGSKQYCIAGNTRFPANYARGVLDDLCVRVIVLDDGIFGPAAFAAVDCIGLSSKVVGEIRVKLLTFAEQNGIVLLNVASTHTHSGVDTMGVWGPIAEVYRNNKEYYRTSKGEFEQSCDLAYLSFVEDTVVEAVKEAFCDLAPGKLYEALIGKNSFKKYDAGDKNLPFTERGLADYVWDRREPLDCSTQLLRLRFQPDDPKKKPTLIVNFGAHPYINGLKLRGKGNGDRLSGDFVWPLGNYIEKSGANFLFVNGAIAGVYPRRLYSGELSLRDQAGAFGREVAMITLGMTKTKCELLSDPLTSPEVYERESGIFHDGKRSVYADWAANRSEEPAAETQLPPAMNIRLQRTELIADNPIFSLIAKLGIGAYNIIRSADGTYRSVTEVGLFELGGGLVRAALIPGELEPAVLSGSDAVTAEASFSGEAFAPKTLADASSDENLVVFGLMNDEIGYIIPDNDFCMMFLGTGKHMTKLFGSHYLEIFSFGKSTASAIAKAFAKLAEAQTE